jgi:NHL repeat
MRASASADGEGPDVFRRIVDVALDPLGRVWVADAQMHEVRVFQPDGRHVRTLGRKGGGPAEFDGIAGMDLQTGSVRPEKTIPPP